ncbi:MAG: STAS domain-containing protein [Actinocrinis sp.]
MLLEGALTHQGSGRAAATAAPVPEDAAVWRITVAGELDLGSVDAVRHCFDEVVHRSPTHVVVDLRGLTFMDSTGIALLLEAAEKVPLLEVECPPATIRAVMETMGLSSVLRISE